MTGTRHSAVSALSLPWTPHPVPSDPPPHCPALLIPFLLLFLMWTSLVTCLLTVRLFSILFLLLYLTGTCHLRSAPSRVISRLLMFLAYAGVTSWATVSACPVPCQMPANYSLSFFRFCILFLACTGVTSFATVPACPVSCLMPAYYRLFSFPSCILFLAHGRVTTCTTVSACPVSCQLKSIKVQLLIGYLDYKFQIFITVHTELL